MYRYEFKKDDAFDFIRVQHLDAKPKGNELQFSLCPYCHGGKSHDKGSFAINLDSGQYKCLRESCGAQGNFVTLARDFNFSLGNEFDNYYSNQKKFIKFKKIEVVVHNEAIEYMKGRGISAETTIKYGITVKDTAKNILIFPFYDENGVLQFIKYRKTDYNKEKDGGYKEWVYAVKDGKGNVIQSCKPILFGMSQCNEKFDRLTLTEGQLDSISVADCGIENAVSVPTGANGFTWVPYCWDWLSKFEELIVFGDFEKGHITLLEEMKKRFPGKIKHVREQDYKGCKDANEILQKHGKQAVIDAVENAIFIPIKRVKQLADVKPKDLNGIRVIKTGFDTIDNSILGGGLYAGQLVILTGKRGGGKSTVSGQIAVEALEQGNKVFSYSGELPDWFFKRWIDLQVAGRRNIVENTNPDGSTYKFVTNSNIDKINDWYRDRFFIYDNNCVEDDELDDLTDTITKAIMQYGINLVIIDNLMTAIDVGMNVDLNRAQGKFVKKLTNLAKRLEVVIILVAHPRKEGFGTNDENDAVSGSSRITDMADLVMTFKRDAETGENENLLSISKNRWFGKFTKDKGINLHYDSSSMRLVDNRGDFDKQYSWTKPLEFQPLSEYEQEELPFGNEDD